MAKEYDFRRKLFYVDPTWQWSLERLDIVERAKIWDAIMHFRLDGSEVDMEGKISGQAMGVYWFIIDALRRFDEDGKAKSEIRRQAVMHRYQNEDTTNATSVAFVTESTNLTNVTTTPSHTTPPHTTPPHTTPPHTTPKDNDDIIEARKSQKRFIPPTLEEVEDYIKKMEYTNVEAKKFLAHYEAQGWTRNNGRAIVSWKAAVKYWACSNKSLYEYNKEHLVQDDSQVGKFNKWAIKCIPFIVGHMQHMLTEEQLNDLLFQYGRDKIYNALASLEDRQEYTSKHTNLYTTLCGWLKQEEQYENK